jgi:hypothetical protein
VAPSPVQLLTLPPRWLPTTLLRSLRPPLPLVVLSLLLPPRRLSLPTLLHHPLATPMRMFLLPLLPRPRRVRLLRALQLLLLRRRLLQARRRAKGSGGDAQSSFKTL